ncbi:hypothetical protein ACIQ9J_21955 [Streptomyces sp. NPDC094153]|uniref:hypothetical protein n=1 Tax=Streptomyces sp. NPDC094153 TaxID=3366058 RepID=UPI003825E5A2
MSTELVTAVVLGLVVNELCDVCPWLARKVIRLAARAVPDREVRRRLEEEWVAGLQDRPGKILKLFSAVTILVSAVTAVRGMYVTERPWFQSLRRLISSVFDREGRIVISNMLFSGVIDTYVNPWGDGKWSLVITAAVLSVAINGSDLWWRSRKARRGKSRRV